VRVCECVCACVCACIRMYVCACLQRTENTKQRALYQLLFPRPHQSHLPACVSVLTVLRVECVACIRARMFSCVRPRVRVCSCVPVCVSNIE